MREKRVKERTGRNIRENKEKERQKKLSSKIRKVKDYLLLHRIKKELKPHHAGITLCNTLEL